jgi:hypothetical protein
MHVAASLGETRLRGCACRVAIVETCLFFVGLGLWLVDQTVTI